MRDTNPSSTSVDCSRESRSPPASGSSTVLWNTSSPRTVWSSAAASDVELLVFSGVGWGDWLVVVGEGCWSGEAGLAMVCAIVHLTWDLVNG